MNKKDTRVAIVVSHPIQHFCPQYLSFSKIEGVVIKLFFASMLGYRRYSDKNFGQEVVWNNLRIEEFDHVFLNGDLVLPSSKEIDAPSLNKELDSFNPNILISYGFFQKLQRRGHRWAKKNSVPIAYINDSENRQYRPLWKRMIKSFYFRWYFKKIDFFLTVGNANESYYKDYGVSPDKFIRMHYPIDITTYRSAFENKEVIRNDIRDKFAIPKDDFVITVVGKLVSWKNQDHLIDLLIKLEASGKKAHLFICGSGAMLESLKEKSKVLNQNKVYYTGFLDPLDLPAYYAACDVYIHPASVEPHSLAISEAIYMGCPAVISDKCGSYGEDDDVQENKNGFVYEFGNIYQLSQIIIELINDRSLINRLGDQSHKIAVNFQDISHERSLKELIKRSKN